MATAIILVTKKNGRQVLFRFEPGMDCLGRKHADGTFQVEPGVHVYDLFACWDYLDSQGFKPVKTYMEGPSL